MMRWEGHEWVGVVIPGSEGVVNAIRASGMEQMLVEHDTLVQET